MLSACVRLFCLAIIAGVVSPCQSGPQETTPNTSRLIILGPGDQLTAWAAEIEELNGKAFTVDRSGYLALPMVGRMKAGGLTIEQFEAELGTAMGKYVRQPQIVLTVTESKSEPVTVSGAVNTPGVYQLKGSTSLAETIAGAGGLRQDAGSSIQITRLLKYGGLPLPGVKVDEGAGVSTAEVEASSAMAGKTGYLPLFPNDLITVPAAGMVYVLGEVGKPGAVPLGNRQTVSLLQALAMAGGLNKSASPTHMKLIRPVPGGERQEIIVDGGRIIKGESPDLPLQSNDILYVQDSLGKKANRRLAEAVVQAATFMLGWGLVR